MKSLEGDKLKYAARLQYQTTNNEVEYKALLEGLELAKSLGIESESVDVQGDSQLIIVQVNGTCEVKEERMKKYLNKVKWLVKKFKEASFIQVPREENIEANALEKVASTEKTMDEYDKVQYKPSIDLSKVQQIEGEENRMTPIVVYLKDERLPEDRYDAKRLRIKAAKYVLIDEVLGA